MAQLAIKGHKTRSKEAIQLLEMLGGVNKYRIDAIRETYVYFVDEDRIIRLLQINQLLPEQYIVYSLEEFEEKFPYKVGDKVYNIIHNENQTITEVAWDFQEDVVVYQTNNNEYLFVNYLQPYKEEIMEKINIAELLKDCPIGMELDSTLFDDIYFDCIDDVCDIIKCYIQESKHKIGISFDKYGHYSNISKSKCVIFPKGKTTWEGFVPPYEFKDGDILSYQCAGFKNRTVYIYMQHSRMNTTYYVALSGNSDSEFMVNDKEGHALNSYNDSVRLATEEEKEKLFQAIKDNGYKWNAETKTLEKLPKFKVGDRIKMKGIDDVYAMEITEVTQTIYTFKNGSQWGIESVGKDYELVPNKFDINILKPFDKVLVRGIDGIWAINFFGFYDENKKEFPFYCIGQTVTGWGQCIPYEKNEHLLGTTNDCDEYYKNW